MFNQNYGDCICFLQLKVRMFFSYTQKHVHPHINDMCNIKIAFVALFRSIYVARRYMLMLFYIAIGTSWRFFSVSSAFFLFIPQLNSLMDFKCYYPNSCCIHTIGANCISDSQGCYSLRSVSHGSNRSVSLLKTGVDLKKCWCLSLSKHCT